MCDFNVSFMRTGFSKGQKWLGSLNLKLCKYHSQVYSVGALQRVCFPINGAHHDKGTQQ